MAGAAAAGAGQQPPSGVQTGARSSIAATVQGAQGMGPVNADARLAGQMGIRPAMPAANGAGVPAPGGQGGPV
jgi:hypothetical protein